MPRHGWETESKFFKKVNVCVQVIGVVGCVCSGLLQKSWTLLILELESWVIVKHVGAAIVNYMCYLAIFMLISRQIPVWSSVQFKKVQFYTGSIEFLNSTELIQYDYDLAIINSLQFRTIQCHLFHFVFNSKRFSSILHKRSMPIQFNTLQSHILQIHFNTLILLIIDYFVDQLLTQLLAFLC